MPAEDLSQTWLRGERRLEKLGLLREVPPSWIGCILDSTCLREERREGLDSCRESLKLWRRPETELWDLSGSHKTENRDGREEARTMLPRPSLL